MTKSLKTIAGYGCYLWIALALTSSASADEKAMDHSKMDHSKMDRQTVAKPEKVVPQKKKLDPAVVKKPKTPPAAS